MHARRYPPLPESCAGASSAPRSTAHRVERLFQSELFSIDDWRCDGHDTARKSEEWNDADRVVVARRGAFRLHSGGQVQLADRTMATVWRAHETYRVTHPVEGGDDGTVFRLTDSGARAFFALSNPRAADAERPRASWRGLPIDGSTYLKHRLALHRARQHLATPADPLAVEEPAVEFLRALSPGVARPQGAAATTCVQLAREVIARDYRKPLSIAAIARTVNASPFHLSRLYRKGTGMTLHRTLMRHRLRDGLERLLDSSESLSTIALEIGFSSHSHFTDAFRAEFGCAPSAARGWSARRAREFSSMISER